MSKDIKGYEGLYKITENAEVINVKTGLVKKPWINNKGYQCIDLSKDGNIKHALLHRLYAEAYIPNPNNNPIVLHLDNNKLNLSPDNLIWGTYSENNSQAIRDKLKPLPRPDNRKVYVLSDTEVRKYCTGIKEVSEEIGMDSNNIHNLVHRKSTINSGPYKGCKIESIDIRSIKKSLKVNVQRSSLGEGVDPEANAGRKIADLISSIQIDK